MLENMTPENLREELSKRYKHFILMGVTKEHEIGIEAEGISQGTPKVIFLLVNAVKEEITKDILRKFIERKNP